MKLNLTMNIIEYKVPCIELEGSITCFQREFFFSWLDDLKLSTKAPGVIVDISRVSFIDSVGLYLLEELMGELPAT